MFLKFMTDGKSTTLLRLTYLFIQQLFRTYMDYDTMFHTWDAVVRQSYSLEASSLVGEKETQSHRPV